MRRANTAELQVYHLKQTSKPSPPTIYLLIVKTETEQAIELVSVWVLVMY